MKVYKGYSSSSSDQLCNIQGDKVFKGYSSSSSDQLCNVSETRFSNEQLAAILFALGQI